MKYTLLYFDEVLIDVKEAMEWYRKQREHLDEEFSFSIFTAIQQILTHPSAYAVRYKNIRIAHPRRFPYNIHFYIDMKTTSVVLTAIVHNRRHPSNAKKRVR